MSGMTTKAGKPVYPYGPPDGAADRPKYAFDDCRNNALRAQKAGSLFARFLTMVSPTTRHTRKRGNRR
jgi:hypothetical protein